MIEKKDYNEFKKKILIQLAKNLQNVKIDIDYYDDRYYVEISYREFHVGHQLLLTIEEFDQVMFKDYLETVSSELSKNLGLQMFRNYL